MFASREKFDVVKKSSVPCHVAHAGIAERSASEVGVPGLGFATSSIVTTATSTTTLYFVLSTYNP